MNANELRIGNFVYDTKGEVNTIDLEAITYIVKEPLNQVKPIPITEDWLIRLGFEKVGELFLKGSLEMFFVDGELRPKEYYTSDAFNDDLKILYIHQVQNIFYALNGYELILQK